MPGPTEGRALAGLVLAGLIWSGIAPASRLTWPMESADWPAGHADLQHGHDHLSVSRGRGCPLEQRTTWCNTFTMDEYKNERSVRIEEVELDDRNTAHATSRVSVAEICQVFDNDPEFRQNRSGRTADYVAIGVTDGGS